jgi:hypothetical protein
LLVGLQIDKIIFIMNEKGIPRDIFEKDPRIRPVGGSKEPDKPQDLRENEMAEPESAFEEEVAGVKGVPSAEAGLAESLEEEKLEDGEGKKPVVEVEETLEKITSLPTIEESKEEVRPARPPRYFEFEEDAGGLVKKEILYEPQSYALPGEEIIEEKTKSFSPLFWLVIVLVLLALVFLIYRLAF